MTFKGCEPNVIDDFFFIIVFKKIICTYQYMLNSYLHVYIFSLNFLLYRTFRIKLLQNVSCKY